MRTIPLACGDWKALVAPEMAFNIISLRYQDEPVLHEPEPYEAVLKDPFLYGIPLLVPPNRLEGDGFTFMGKRYAIPYVAEDGRFHLHGRLKNAPITVTRVEENLIMGEFFSDVDRYPFPFKLTIIYELAREGLKTRHVVTNVGEEPMAFVIGFHTSFESKPFFNVSLGQAWEMGAASMFPTKLTQLSEEQKKYAGGMNPTGVAIDGMFTDSGEHRALIGRFRYHLSDQFTNWVLWNMGGKQNLLCLEPQTCSVNGLNTGDYTIILPGKSETYESEITLNR